MGWTLWEQSYVSRYWLSIKPWIVRWWKIKKKGNKFEGTQLGCCSNWFCFSLFFRLFFFLHLNVLFFSRYSFQLDWLCSIGRSTVSLGLLPKSFSRSKTDMRTVFGMVGSESDEGSKLKLKWNTCFNEELSVLYWSPEGGSLLQPGLSRRGRMTLDSSEAEALQLQEVRLCSRTLLCRRLVWNESATLPWRRAFW